MTTAPAEGVNGSSSFVIEADDPCLDGHFPGNPLVPGVVLLDFAAHALALQGVGSAIAGVAHVKFASPLRPCEPFTIECRHVSGSVTAWFRCRSGERLIAEGSFDLRSPAVT